MSKPGAHIFFGFYCSKPYAINPEPSSGSLLSCSKEIIESFGRVLPRTQSESRPLFLFLIGVSAPLKPF